MRNVKAQVAAVAISFIGYAVPYFALAQATNPGRELLYKFARIVINPVITVLFAVALAFFLLGIIRFIAGGESEEVRQKGRDHILWGLVGMGLMFAAFAVLRLVTNTFGIDQAPINAFQKGI